jgi:hypothetical protein
MKGSQLFLLSRSKGMTVDIWIRDYNPPRCFQKKISGRSKHDACGHSRWPCYKTCIFMQQKNCVCSTPEFILWHAVLFNILVSNKCACISQTSTLADTIERIAHRKACWPKAETYHRQVEFAPLIYPIITLMNKYWIVYRLWNGVYYSYTCSTYRTECILIKYQNTDIFL